MQFIMKYEILYRDEIKGIIQRIEIFNYEYFKEILSILFEKLSKFMGVVLFFMFELNSGYDWLFEGIVFLVFLVQVYMVLKYLDEK